MSDESTYESRLGSLDLINLEIPYETSPDGNQDGWWFRTRVAGFDLGSPEAEQIIHASMLLDGEDVETLRWKPRTITLTVEVCSLSNHLLPQGIAELRREIGHRNTWTWRPPGVDHVSNFLVLTSTMRSVGTQLEYLDGWSAGAPVLNVVRLPFEITLTCQPWAYSSTEITETFTAGATDTSVVLDECTSKARWPSGFLGTYNGESVISHYPFGYTWELQYQDNAIPAAPYFFIDVAVQRGVFVPPGIRFNYNGSGVFGANTFPVAAVQLANGFTRYVFALGSEPTAPFVNFSSNVSIEEKPDAIVHVSRVGTMTSLPPTTLFALQQQGSVRAPARLRIGHTSDDLGEVFVYADPTMLSHGWTPDETTRAPEGDYVAYIGGDGRLGGYPAGTMFEVTINGQSRTTVTQWSDTPGRWFPVGPFHLGGRFDRRVGTLTYTVKRGSINIVSPKPLLKLFREADHIQLLHGREMQRRLFVEPASFDNLRPGIYTGDAADGSDALSTLATIDAEGYPILDPTTTALYVDCSGTDSPLVEVTHRPAFDGLATL